MRIEQLEYVVELSHHRTFASASESLFIAPQSLSRSIASIEQEIGLPLLERSAKGIRFTPSGETFLQMAQNILREYYTTVDKLKESSIHQTLSKDLKGDLYLYSYAIFLDTILSKAIHGFKSSYPGVNVFPLSMRGNMTIEDIIAQTKREQILLSVHAVNADFNRMETVRDMNNVRAYNVTELRGEYYACCHKSCPLAQHKEVSLKVVAQYPMIKFTAADTADVFSNDMIGKFIHYNFDTEPNRQIAFATDSLIEWLAAIKHNAGVGLLYDIAFSKHSVIKALFDDIAIIRIRERPTIEPIFYTSETPSDIALSFLQYFINTFK